MGIIDLTNQRFGNLLVLERDVSKKASAAYWICKCDCGNSKSIRGQSLRNGSVTHCGCQKTKRVYIDKDFLGKKFGRLTVIDRDLSKPQGRGHESYWICQCDCGKQKSISRSSLIQGHTKSCGCLKSEMVTKKNTLDLTNIRFGKLIAVENTNTLSEHKSFLWKCICDCGNICYKSAESLQSGKIHSCGCIQKSFGEETIAKILTENNIFFNSEYTFFDLKNPETNRFFRYDFAILNENNQVIRLIEFDGEQHYKEKNNSFFDYDFIQQSDKIKNDYALNRNIPLVRIPYTEINNLSLELILGDRFLIQ